MHGHVSKHVKMQRKPTSGTKKHGKHIIMQNGERERYARSNRHHEDASRVVTSEHNLMGVESNHPATNLPRVLTWQSLELERLT